MKKRILSALLTCLIALTLLPTAAFAASGTGTGITPTTDPNLWTTRLTSTGASYSYRPPTAAGEQLYCMDLGYSYRYGTASFLNSYTYQSATGTDADALWNEAVAKTGLGEMDAITKENVKWMMSYIADYTGEIPGSLFMALQTYIWDNQTNKSAGGDTSGDIDAGGYANADTYEVYKGYYEWLLAQKANEDAELQAQVEKYTAQGIQASIVEDDASKWAVFATSSVSGRQSFFAYHTGRKVVTQDAPDIEDTPPVAGDADITFQKVRTGTTKGLAGAVYNIYLDGQIVGSDVTDSSGVIEVNGVTEGLWTFAEVAAPEGYALDPTPHSVYVDTTDGDRQYTVTAEDDVLPSMELVKLDAQDGDPIPGTVLSVKSVTGSYSTSVTTGRDGTATLEDLPVGVYVIREESVPEPYVLSSSEQTVALAPGKTSTVTFEDYTKPGLEILKFNIANNNPIEGVTYKIKQIDGSYSTTATTNAGGRIFLENIPVGSYEITEVTVPSNVILCDIPQTVALTAGTTSTITFFNATKPALTIYKHDADTGDAVPGTVFSVALADCSSVNEVETGEDGSVTLADLAPGVYEITEKSVPSPYLLDAEPQTVTLNDSESKTIYFVNHKKPSLTIHKISSITKDPIAGAKFQVWYGSNSTSTGEINSIGTYYTDSSGQIVLTDLQDGWYKVTELEPASGYAIKGSGTQECYIAGGESKELTFENVPLSALVVYKYDSVTGAAVEGAVFQVSYLGGDTSGTGGTVIGTYKTSANGSFTVTGLKAGTYIVEELASDSDHVIDTAPQTAYISGKDQDVVSLYFGNSPKGALLIKKIDSVSHAPLSDVQFFVTTSDGAVVGNGNGYFTSDSAGTVLIEGIDPGETLVVKEAIAKDGYLLDDTPQTAKIIAGETVTLEFRNQPLGNLIINKLSSKDKTPLEGVQFKITYADGTFVDAAGGALSSNGLYWTNENGQIILPALTGTVVVTEVESIDGYTIDENTRTQTVVVNPGDTQQLYFYNTPIGGVEIIKTDADKSSQRIANTEFEIREMDGGLVDTVKTGSNGRVFLALEDGDYYAVETAAAKGYRLDETPHYFTVENGKTTTLSITNKAISGILIHKTDSTTGDGIYGVSFILYDSTNTPIDQQTSDDRGYVYFEDLESGRYYLRELENEGYILDTQKKTVYVKSGETTEIEWENTPITGQIQVTKTSADYNSVNGWPAGTPIPNTVFEVYNAKNGRLVDTIQTDKNGVAVTRPLPLGRYKVIESKAADFYGLDKTPIEVEIEFAGQIVKAAMTNKSLYTNVSVKKVGYSEVMPGGTLRYDLSNIANNSTTSLESFYWRDTLPTFATLDKIVTGTWNVVGSYKIVYKTTLSGGTYRVLADNLSTQQNYVLDASPAALGLASNEKVTEFMAVFGIVPSNFRQVEAPRVYCTASKWLTGGSQIVNQADVGGVYNGQWIMATSRWVTTVYKKTEPLPRTGY